MKYVSVTTNSVGNVIDPTEYLDVLPSLQEALPNGARAFAADRDHYDFHGRRCMKDLVIEAARFGDHDGRIWVELQFRHNCWKHDEDLTITYQGVQRFAAHASDGPSNWTVIVDEILPGPSGCTHEIACLSGSIAVDCEDLQPVWAAAECVTAH